MTAPTSDPWEVASSVAPTTDPWETAASTQSQPSYQSPPYSWSGLGQNALQDAKNQVVGLGKMGIDRKSVV